MAAIGTVVTVTGLAAVLGGWLTLSVSHDRMEELSALGAGLLMGSALLTMLPAALHDSARGPAGVAGGYFGMLVLQRAMAGSRPNHGLGRRAPGPALAPGGGPAAAATAAAGLALHSLFEGAALGVTQHVGGQVGLFTFLAVALHKLPEGFSLAALVLGAGGSAVLALLSTALLGLATALGSVVPLLWVRLGTGADGALLGLAAGSFLYVGATDLLPAQLRRGRSQTALVLLGAALIFLLTRGVPHSH